MTKTIRLPQRTMQDIALGFFYWLAFLLALEPGNMVNAHSLSLSGEAARIAGAVTIGALATPLVLELVRRYPIEGRAWWRRAALEIAGAAIAAAGLIFVSCVLADWFLSSEHRTFLTALPEELAVNGFLLFFCICGLLGIGHAMRKSTESQAKNEVTPHYISNVVSKSRGRSVLVAVNDIEWIETQGNYLALHTRGGVRLIRETLANFESQLDPTRFARIHRRTIVAIDRIDEIESAGSGDANLVLKNGTSLRLSRSHRERFLSQNIT